MRILDILNELSAEPSKNAKIAILTREKYNDLLKAVFKAAYDTSINYYIKKIPNYIPNFTDNVATLPDIMSQVDSEIVSRKKTGNVAIEFLRDCLDNISSDNAEVLTRIIQRDLKVGCSTSTANKVWKNLIPDYPYQRCSLLSKVDVTKWDWSLPHIVQEKSDGLYASVTVVDGDVTILSRSGSEFPLTEFANIVSDLSSFNGKVFTGELLVVRDGCVLSREIGNGMYNSVLSGGKFQFNCKPIFHVWDMLPLELYKPKANIDIPYLTRFADLSNLIGKCHSVSVINSKFVNTLDEAFEYYRELVSKGYEGAILKHRDGGWKDTTSKFQVKMKVEADCDLIIKGFVAGNGKNTSTFGSISCESSDGTLKVDVSGFTDSMRLEIWNNKESYLDSIMAVTYNSIMPPTNKEYYSLFLPRFLEFRQDKTVADSIDMIKDSFNALLQGK